MRWAKYAHTYPNSVAVYPRIKAKEYVKYVSVTEQVCCQHLDQLYGLCRYSAPADEQSTKKCCFVWSSKRNEHMNVMLASAAAWVTTGRIYHHIAAPPLIAYDVCNLCYLRRGLSCLFHLQPIQAEKIWGTIPTVSTALDRARRGYTQCWENHHYWKSPAWYMHHSDGCHVRKWRHNGIEMKWPVSVSSE